MTNASILSILVEVHYYAPAKVLTVSNNSSSRSSCSSFIVVLVVVVVIVIEIWFILKRGRPAASSKYTPTTTRTDPNPFNWPYRP